MMNVRDLTIKDSGLGSIHENTETDDLLDAGPTQLDIWHPDDGYQDNGNEERHDTTIAIKKVRDDAESASAQERTRGQNISDVEEVTLSEEFSATKGVSETFHSQRQVVLIKMRRSKWTEQNPDGEHEDGMHPNVLEKSIENPFCFDQG